MTKPRKHIFVCRNYREIESGKHSCEARGAAEIYEEFKRLRAEAGIVSETRLTKVQCFGKCKHGPNVVIYPDNVWYCDVKPEDVAEIIDQHIMRGYPVTRKILPDDLI